MSETPEEMVRWLGLAIAARRRDLNLSQAEVAERLGMVSPESLSRYERGEREPRCTTLARIAAALDTRPSVLMQALDPRPVGSAYRVAPNPAVEDALIALDTHLRLLSVLEPAALKVVGAMVETMVETLPARRGAVAPAR